MIQFANHPEGFAMSLNNILCFCSLYTQMNTISFALNFFWGHFIFFFDTESTLTRSDELLVVTEFYNIAGNDFDEKKNLPIVDNRHVFVVTKLVVSETQCIFWQLF